MLGRESRRSGCGERILTLVTTYSAVAFYGNCVRNDGPKWEGGGYYVKSNQQKSLGDMERFSISLKSILVI